MANSHAEDAAGIAAAIRTLATKEELSESEQRLTAASEALRDDMLEEIRDRDKRMRGELKVDLEQAVEKNRFFSPQLAAAFENILTGLGLGIVIFMGALGLSKIIIFLIS